MFKIEKLDFPDLNIEIEFDKNYPRHKNTISIFTGPNGSGKTEILYRLASVFGNVGKPCDLELNKIFVKQEDKQLRVTKEASEEFFPLLVITQTFSPFSRFPQIPQRKSDAYTKSTYNPIGLHRGKTWSSQAITKDILEKSLIALSQDTKKADVYAKTLDYLGYFPKVKIEFSTMLYDDFFSDLTSNNVVERFDEFLKRFEATNKNFNQQKIFRELNKDSDNSIGHIRDLLVSLSGAEFIPKSPNYKNTIIQISYDFEETEKNDIARLKTLLRLRDVGLFSLSKCELESKTYLEKTIDLSEASSGEQQIISSVFGILAVIESNSLLLIDEPEISLHPKWQLQFIGLLENVLNGYDGCHVIVSTHSPLIVQSAQSQSHQIIRMPQRFNHRRESENQDHPSVEEALVEVFNTPIPRSTYLSNRILEIVSSVDDNDKKDEALNELNRYLEIYSLQKRDRTESTLKLLNDAIKLVRQEDFDLQEDSDA